MDASQKAAQKGDLIIAYSTFSVLQIDFLPFKASMLLLLFSK